MLQSLLQPRDHCGKMIAAMPAVAVRHERRRQEKRNRRPSQLALGRSTTSPGSTPSPQGHGHSEYLLCFQVTLLHAIVGSILLGVVIMVVGLVQLSPGAEAAKHRYYLITSGAVLIAAGVIGAFMRRLVSLITRQRKQRLHHQHHVEAQRHQETSKLNPTSTTSDAAQRHQETSKLNPTSTTSDAAQRHQETSKLNPTSTTSDVAQTAPRTTAIVEPQTPVKT